MEYVGELCSRAEAEARSAAHPPTEIYLMELGGGKQCACIDALYARSAPQPLPIPQHPRRRAFAAAGLTRVPRRRLGADCAAFANFGCLRATCNMEMRAVLTQHWDRDKPHACFFATRDIEAGETLTYLRDQAAITAVSGRVGAVVQGGVAPKPIKCLCGHLGCRGFA